MKNKIEIPGLLVAVIPIMLYVIYIFIGFAISVYTDNSLCYCTDAGLSELPPSQWQRIGKVIFTLILMFIVLIAIEYLVHLYTDHIDKLEAPWVLYIVLYPLKVLGNFILISLSWIDENFKLKI